MGDPEGNEYIEEYILRKGLIKFDVDLVLLLP